MKIGKKKKETLGAILDRIWLMLERGASQPDTPFHWPVLGTASKDGCSMRTVILRQVDAATRMLVCHTDARAEKVREIENCAHTSWLFYDPEDKIQLRISGLATLHAHDDFADRQWADTNVTSRLNYCATHAPGSPIDKPSSGLPDLLLKKVPTLLDTESVRKHFMVIAVKVCSIDWLSLRITGNLRARFDWDRDRLRATWLVP